MTESAGYSLNRFIATTRGAMLSLLLLTMFIRSQCLLAGFLADDFLHVERARDMARHGLNDVLTAFTLTSTDLGLTWYTPPDIQIQYFRPLSSALFLMDFHLWGLSPRGYHLTNLLLHAVNVLLVFALARLLLRDTFPAWLAALLFLLHPASTEAVNWISARTELIMTTFVLAAVLRGVALHQALIETTPIPRRIRLAAETTGLAFLALLAKESGIVCAGLLFLVIDVRAAAGIDARRFRAPLAALAAVIPYIMLRIRFMDLASNFPPAYFTPPSSARFIPVYLFKMCLYLGHFTFFNPVDAFLARPLYHTHWYLAPLLIVLTLLLVRFLHRTFLAGTRLGRFLLWVPVSLAPSALVFLGKRFLYLPLAGVAVVLAAVLNHVLRRGGPVRIGRLSCGTRSLLMAVLAMLFFMTAVNDAFTVRHTRELGRQVARAAALLQTYHGPLEIHFTSMWFPMAIGLDHALRLQRTAGTLDVHAWWLFYYPNKGQPIMVNRKSDDHYVLELGSIRRVDRDLAEFYLWGTGWPETVTNDTFESVTPQWHDGEITTLDVKLNPARCTRIILNFSGGRITPVLHQP
ncbi:hypothetical protein JW905_01135 [bacterium]|nr:hypothetical protein [candidate division CSSED10-310 bacterium]